MVIFSFAALGSQEAFQLKTHQFWKIPFGDLFDKFFPLYFLSLLILKFLLFGYWASYFLFFPIFLLYFLRECLYFIFFLLSFPFLLFYYFQELIFFPLWSFSSSIPGHFHESNTFSYLYDSFLKCSP